MVFLYNKAIAKKAALIKTIVAPAGISKKKESVIPHKTERIASIIEISIAALKPLAS